mmetsp:Transcript_6300/g.13713  ORF Transcript_6300/g.13713 Transcript_6300/m.13713 type:complete len:481 (-) Transcript_6300:161-1603(-)
MAIFSKRQAMIISSVATARSMTIRFSGGVMADAIHTSWVASRYNHHNAGAAGAFVAPTSSCRRSISSSSRSAQSLLPTVQLLANTRSTTTINSSLTRRHFSATDGGDDDQQSSHSNNEEQLKPRTITLPNKTGDRNGLIRHQIIAEDGHPLRLYSRNKRKNGVETPDNIHQQRNTDVQRAVLLIHGRTWSSQPVFDLRTSDDDVKRQSTLQSLADLGFHAYALDLRGFGETLRDYSEPVCGYTTPRRCVADVKCAIDWITKRHKLDEIDDASDNNMSINIPGMESPTTINYRPALVGWSQGALVAQMYAQMHGTSTLSDLVLFGSIYDPKIIYPRKPLYDPSGALISGGPNVKKPPPPEVRNTDIDSLEDFTLPGTICDEAALCYSKLALAVDPVKGAWDELHEFNILNPALVHVPTMVLVGAQDPYTSWDAQRELFDRLGTEDKAMCVLPGCDHAAHILKARKMFVRAVAGFLLRKDEF